MTEADNQVAAQNVEAATANPTDAQGSASGPAAGQIDTGSSINEGSSLSEGSSEESPELAAERPSAQASQMHVTSGVQGPQTDAEKIEVAVYQNTIAAEADNTDPEKEVLAALRGYRRAAEVRFKHLLTGMANSTAEALRCMAEAELFLANHIDQRSTN